MTSSTHRMRLLPWTSPEGNPCYLAGNGTGRLSRLADTMEETQLDLAHELVDEARQTLAERTWTPEELHLLTARLTEALIHVHRIAQSRGSRLTPVFDDPDTTDDPATEDNKRDRPPPAPHT